MKIFTKQIIYKKIKIELLNSIRTIELKIHKLWKIINFSPSYFLYVSDLYFSFKFDFYTKPARNVYVSSLAESLSIYRI